MTGITTKVGFNKQAVTTHLGIPHGKTSPKFEILSKVKSKMLAESALNEESEGAEDGYLRSRH